MKILALTILITMCFSCSKHRNFVQMENFNITVMSTEAGTKIDLKKGRIEYYQRMDVAEEDFLLDSIERDSIFSSVPWQALEDIPNYYNPTIKCDGGSDNQYFFELVILNDQMHKTIRLRDCNDFSNDVTETHQILQCIKIINGIVLPKSSVKPLIKIDV